MRLKEFRELTKDLPDDTTIIVLDPGQGSAWKFPQSVEVIETQHRYVGGQDIPDAMKQKQVELRIKLPV
jgi:hypothetical protein